MARRLRILALEPYYGGSHRAVLDCLTASIDADWTLLTLPARKWKWRMRGAAMTMAAEVRHLGRNAGEFDVIFASTFLNLAEFARARAAGAQTDQPRRSLAYPARPGCFLGATVAVTADAKEGADGGQCVKRHSGLADAVSR